MNRTLDYVLGTQIATCFAWACAVMAHLLDRYGGETWFFGVVTLLIMTVVFMIFPYILLCNEKHPA